MKCTRISTCPLVGVCLLAPLAVALLSCGGGANMPPRQLVQIGVDPFSGDAVAPTGTLPFSADGTFNLPPNTETNLSVLWSSSDINVATIDPNSGLATCIAVGGPVTISAAASGIKGSGTLTCLASPPPSGHCVAGCVGDRCDQFTGSCSGSSGGVCRLATDPVHCPAGHATTVEKDGCNATVDPTTTCTL